MNVQMQNYRSVVNFSDVEAAVLDGEFERLVSTALAREEVLDICGLSDAMMDDIRDMVIY